MAVFYLGYIFALKEKKTTTNKLYTSNSAVQLSQLKDFQELEGGGDETGRIYDCNETPERFRAPCVYT